LVESAACACEAAGIATSKQIKAATGHRDFDMGFESSKEWVAHAVPAHERGRNGIRNDP